MISYTPTHKKYKPVTDDTLIGEAVRVITCLENSETVTKTNSDGKRSLELITRYYSLAVKEKTQGHAPRFVLSNVYQKVSETMRVKVVAAERKKPHAWLYGDLTEFVSNDDDARHEALKAEILNNGGCFIAYDPYKTSEFVLSGAKNLRGLSLEKLNQLVKLSEKGISKKSTAKRAYCFEDGILIEF